MDVQQIIYTIVNSIFSGVFALFIFIAVNKYAPVKPQLAVFGIFNKWLILATLLYTVGFTRHMIGYYAMLETSYCNTTEMCDDIINNGKQTTAETVKQYLLPFQGIWMESAGEGIAFMLVGLPAFIYLKNKMVAAFLIGVFAHLVAEYSGYRQYFCKKTCNVIPTLNI